MKKIKYLIGILAFVGFGFSMTSCGDSNKADATEQTGPEYTSAYICPMHCKGSGSSEPGTCPVCKMDYKKNEK